MMIMKKRMVSESGGVDSLSYRDVRIGAAAGDGAIRVFSAVGRAASSVFAGIAFILLLAGTGTAAMLGVASAAIGVSLVSGVNPFSLIPPMPYWCGAVLAVATLALALLAAVGCAGCWLLLRRFWWAYSRFLLGSESEKVYPAFSAKTGERLKRTALLTLAVFAGCFVSGFAVCAVTAGTLGFWHSWNWFVI